MKIRKYLNEKIGMERWHDMICEKIGWERFPEGWTKKSVRKFVKSLTGKSKSDPEGMFTECYNRMKDEEGFDEEGAKKFCASLKDEIMGDPYWRGDPGKGD